MLFIPVRFHFLVMLPLAPRSHQFPEAPLTSIKPLQLLFRQQGNQLGPRRILIS